MRRRTQYAVAIFIGTLAAALLLSPCVEQGVWAQSWSVSTGSPTVPPPPPPGPCPGPFSPDGDIFDFGPASVPMGPPGCGLGWPGLPGNVNAFSSGLGMGSPVPFPAPAAPGSLFLLFGVDGLATGDTIAGCVPAAPGPTPPDLGSEACAQPAATDAPADIYITSANAGPWGVPGAPPPGNLLPQSQLFDGDGLIGPACVPPFAPLGLAEPVPGGDDLDALDGASVGVWDAVADGVPDIPVYYSVDFGTAAGSGGFALAADIIVSVGGVAAIYAPAAALAMGPGDDVDALAVFDAAGDGIYTPPADQIFYSVGPGSFAIGAPDCLGIPIEEGDILTEGAPFGLGGLPCVVGYSEENGIWSARLCGPNPITGLGGDNMNAVDVFTPPPTTITTSTTVTTVTSTTSTSTTTTLGPLCGAAPEAASSCRLNTAAKGQIQYKDKDPGVASKKDKFKWKWGKGVGAVATADFKDPLTGSATYRVCVYDSTGKLAEMDLPPGGTCAKGKPCWKATGTKGFKYKDKDATPDGINAAKFKEGVAGKPKVQIKGKGANLPMPTLPLSTPITVQMLIDDGLTTDCFQTTFTTTIKNDANQVKAKGP